MMNRNILLILIGLLGFVGLNSVFTVTETEYAMRFQLGRIVQDDYQPGIHIKLPFVNNIRKFESRLLTLDTAPEAMITSEQKFVEVDSFVKWRIVDVPLYYTATNGGDEQLARQRLDGVVRERIEAFINSAHNTIDIKPKPKPVKPGSTKAASQATGDGFQTWHPGKAGYIYLPDPTSTPGDKARPYSTFLVGSDGNCAPCLSNLSWGTAREECFVLASQAGQPAFKAPEGKRLKDFQDSRLLIWE